MRFDVTLWDIHGYRLIRILKNAYSLSRQNEILGENVFEFSFPIKDPNFSYLKHRSIIRLIDNNIPRVESTVSAISTTNKTVTLADATGISIGDYVQVFEIALSAKTDTTEAIVPSASAKFDVTTPGNLSVDNFYYIEGESATGIKSSEAFQVISKSGVEITADIGFAYKTGAVITEPGRSFIGKVTLKNGNLLTLSRVDISSSSSALVRKVNFETFRIKEITETRENGIAIARVRCEHLMYDLNDTQFFKDSRVDISYSSKGPNQVIEDKVDISTFIDNILERHVPISNTPLKLQSFIKGDIYRFRYSLGTCSTAGTTTITGDTEANWNATIDDVFFSGGSSIAIEGESGLLTIGRKTGSTVITTTAASTTASGKKYQIISKGAHTGVAKVGTCDVSNGSKIVSGFIGMTVNDGSVQYGARLQIAGDPKIYIVDYVNNNPDVILTENIERANGNDINCVIQMDERPINISSAVSLLGALKTMCEAFTDDRQQVWYEIGEDRSINVHIKPKPDGRDPTSDLVVRYTDAINKNLKSIQRQFNPTPFGNRLIPLGASSDWINAESGITTAVSGNAQNGKERYVITAGDNEKFRLGDPLQIFRNKVTGTVNSSTQVTLTVSPSPGWNIDQFIGGLVLITSGDGKDQMRRVISNSADKITVGRRWNILPTGSTFTVARDIGNAFIRGWGYYKDIVKAATGTTFQINGYAPTDHVYRGGLMTVLSGTGVGQVKVIIDNIASGGNTLFTVSSTDQFSPTLVPDNSIVEIFALSQVVEEKRSGTTFTDGGTTATRYVQYTPDRAHTVDMWNGGVLHITSGSNTARYAITDTTLSGSDVRIHVDTWTSGIPTAGDGILAILGHQLVMNINPGLEFTAADTDTIALLLKEHGGPLTVGKYHLYRSTVYGGAKITQTSFTVQSGHGTRFAKDMIIFIGSKSITSSVMFDLNRGNQIQGQTATIKSVSGDVITFNETLNPTPQPSDHVEIIALVDPNSIVTHGIIEVPFTQSDTNDPSTLYTQGSNELKRIKTIQPKYEIGFFHLYELDSSKYPFDNYELGDTIRVIDDEIKIDVSNLQILKESYNPNTPADMSNTVEAGVQPKQYIRDTAVKQAKKQQEQEQKISKLQRGWDTPKCAFWSDAQKKCTRIIPPNRFCDSDESFHDGRRTREGFQITQGLHCQSYTTITEDAMNKAREIITELVEINVTGITNTSFDTYPTTTNSAAVNVDFRVTRAVPIVVNVDALVTVTITGSTSTDGSHSHGTTPSQSFTIDSSGSHSHTFSDTDAIRLGIDADGVAVQILQTLNNEIAPYNTGATVIGLIKGCRVQYRNTVTATYSSVDTKIAVLCIGQKE